MARRIANRSPHEYDRPVARRLHRYKPCNAHALLLLFADICRGRVMNVNIEFDSSVSSAPAGFQNAMLTAASLFNPCYRQYYDQHRGGYGEIDGTTLTNLCSGGPSGGHLSEYTQLPSEAVLAEPRLRRARRLMRCRREFDPGPSQVAVWSAEAKALGLLAANNAAVDGYIGIGTNIPQGDLSARCCTKSVTRWAVVNVRAGARRL